MHGLMMDFELTIPTLVRRAEQYHARKQIVSRLPDRSLHRTTYGELIVRARKLGTALEKLGVQPGDRVATFCWNHSRHLEAYYAIPCIGAVLHTLNLRLFPDDLAYIASHAGDSVIIVDRVLWPAFEKFKDRVAFKHIIVIDDDGSSAPIAGTLDYETLIAGATPHAFDKVLDERAAAAMCYTSGTTGRPKGVVYSHRSTVLHTFAFAMTDIDLVRETDTVIAVVPMFHANAWGIPYTALMMGAQQLLPGSFLDPASVLGLMQSERATVALGVPTIWNAVLQTLDANPGKYDISSVRVMGSGGSAVPPSMFRAFDRHGVHMIHLWGMTETSPLGSHSRATSSTQDLDEASKYRFRFTQGRCVPFVEVRIRGEDGIAPWDDATMGELEVRGPWVINGYYNSPESADRFTDDGWFKTGDIATIDADGWLTLRDRSKDVIKSGGEWISSVALENMIMSHEAVAEAMVIGLAHPQWDERPLALVVKRAGRDCCADDVLAHLAPHFPKWSLPSGVEFVETLPRTSVGKFDKKVARQQYDGYFTSMKRSTASL
jgi:fatty-acyl-CoA synthase